MNHDLTERNQISEPKSWASMATWPVAISVSMLSYGYLTGFLDLPYEVALQYHFIGLMIGIFILEQVNPYHKVWNKYCRQGWNDILYNITFTVTQIFTALLSLWIVERLDISVLGFWEWGALPVIVEFLALVLLIDLIWYACHRLFHTAPGLWKIHVLHHNSEQLHVVNNARLHPFEVFAFFLPITLVVELLGVPIELLSWYLAFQLTIGLLTHSNISVKTGWFSYFFNTPELHHWHHSPRREEHDNNYGSVTVVWDILFGTYYNPKGKAASSIIGANAEVPIAWFPQLLMPFTNIPKKESASTHKIGGERVE